MLKKFLDGITDGAFGIVADVIADSGAFENVVESERGRHLVQLDFHNAAADVIFENDNERGVVLIRHVEQVGIVAENLVALLGDNHDRRFVEKVNHVVDRLTVDGGSDKFAGQNGRAKALFLAAIVAERFVSGGQVNVDNGLHEFGDAVLNCLALIYTRFVVAAFANFAGEGAQDNGEGGTVVADFLLTEAGAQNSRVKFGERAVIIEVVGVSDFVGGKHFAEFLVVALLDNAAFSAAEQFLIIFAFKVGDVLDDLDVGNDANFRRINL